MTLQQDSSEVGAAGERQEVAPGISEAEAMRRLMDSLPIYATKIGFRTDSTAEEELLGRKLFKVHETWAEIREASSIEEFHS